MERQNHQCSEVDLAYAAGFVDGEGSIMIQKWNGYNKSNGRYVRYRVMVNVTNTKRDILDWFKENFGGYITTRPQKKNWRESYMWRVDSANSHRFLSLIAPYLRLKNEQALLAMKFHEVCMVEGTPTRLDAYQIELRENYLERIRFLNKRGVE